MIRRHVIMSAVTVSVMLSSCGGGKKSSSPSPTPTATASPTSTPTPTYAAFPLGAAVAGEFHTFNATTSYTGALAGTITLGVAGSESFTDRVRYALSGAISNDATEYVVRESTEESRFKKANLTTVSAAGNPEIVFASTSTAAGAEAGNFSKLTLLNNIITGSVTSDALLGSLTQVGYGIWERGVSTAGAKRLTTTVYGYPTSLTDLPTGTKVYTSKVAGRVVSSDGAASAVNTLGGTVQASVNFATGSVTLSFNLTQTTAGGITTNLPAFSAEGALPSGANKFTGSITSGSTISGTIAGGLFGPQGNQIGVTFAGSGLAVSGGTNNLRIVGSVVGKFNPV